jgi:hypothetical protein
MNRLVVVGVAVALGVNMLAACPEASPPLAAAASSTPAPALAQPTPAQPTPAQPTPSPAASASTLWDAAQPFVVAPRNMKTVGEVLWPLAFTADSHLVTLTALVDDGQGGVRFRLRAHNLDNDSEVVLVQWHSDGDLKDPAASFRALSPDKKQHLDRFLAGREAKSPGTPAQAPLSHQGDTFRVLVDAPKPVGTFQDGMQTQRFKVSLVSAQRGEKVLGNIDGLVDETGVWYRRALEQAWFLVSPFEPRAAVLVQIDSRGFEGPPNPQTLQVLGAHLETRFQR